MKKYFAAVLFLSGIIFVSAVGCGGTPAQEETDSAREQEEAGGAQAQKEEAQGGTENARAKEAISSLSEEAKSAYHSVLYDIYLIICFRMKKAMDFWQTQISLKMNLPSVMWIRTALRSF